MAIGQPMGNLSSPSALHTVTRDLAGRDIRLFVYSGIVGVHHAATSVSTGEYTSFVPTRINEIEVWAPTGVELVETTVSVAPSVFWL